MVCRGYAPPTGFSPVHLQRLLAGAAERAYPGHEVWQRVFSVQIGEEGLKAALGPTPGFMPVHLQRHMAGAAEHVYPGPKV